MEEKQLQQRAEELKALYARAPFGKTIGMKLSYTDRFEAVFELAHHRELEHAMGDIHGGAVATLLDNAGWFTAAVRYANWIATVELQVRMLEPARRETLRAQGRLVRAGSRLAVAEMDVRSASGRLVAIGSGTFSVTSLRFPEDRPAADQ